MLVAQANLRVCPLTEGQRRLGRGARIFFLFGALLGVATLLCGGVVFILSGGDVLDFVQDTLTSLALNARQEALNTPAGGDITPVFFTIQPGDTPPVIARRLADANLITDADLFVDYVRANDLDVQLEAGDYYLYQVQTIPEIALTLTDSRGSFILFRVLPGQRIEEIAAQIDSDPRMPFSGAEFLAIVGAGVAVDPDFVSRVGLPPGASLEGFLYPDTYQLPLALTPEMLRDQMLLRFFERVGTQLPVAAAAQGWSLFQVVTLASIVERESLHNDEDARIAGVYRNRLDLDMLLQADPTVQYGLNNTRGTWWAQITQADYYAVDSPYNTYLNAGLPPGPIANPGISAIQGVVDPVQSDDIFFRARCDGSGYHNFAETLDGHNANACS